MTATLDTPNATEYHEAMPLGRIHPDPINPRTNITVDDDFIASVAAGIIEPLIVRPDPTRDTLLGDPEDFLVVAGERRLTAAQAAKLATVPVIVRYDLADDADAIEVMIVENGHRESLPPLDEARAYAVLVEKGRTQREIAAAVGREQGTVSKRLSLIKLPERAQQLLRDERITVKTALGMTGLIKDNGRLSKVLDYAAQNSWADDSNIAGHVNNALQQIKNEKENVARAKAVEKNITVLRAGKLEEKTEDDLDGKLEECEPDDTDATVFVVRTLWNGEKYIEHYKPRTESVDDDAPSAGRNSAYVPSPEDEAEDAARTTRANLIVNLIGDGYPGDEAALALIITRCFRSEVARINDYEVEEFGFEPRGDEDYEEWEQKFAAAIGGPTVRGLWAASLINGEDQYSEEDRREQLQVLIEHGYTPTLPDERALLGDTIPDGDFDESDDRHTGEEERVVPETVGGEEPVVHVEEHAPTDAAPVPLEVTTDTDEEPPEEPFNGYDAFPLASVIRAIENARSNERLQKILAYEPANKNRADVIDAAHTRLGQLEAVAS